MDAVKLLTKIISFVHYYGPVIDVSDNLKWHIYLLHLGYYRNGPLVIFVLALREDWKAWWVEFGIRTHIDHIYIRTYLNSVAVALKHQRSSGENI